jgi:hypothetical protein
MSEHRPPDDTEWVRLPLWARLIFPRILRNVSAAPQIESEQALRILIRAAATDEKAQDVIIRGLLSIAETCISRRFPNEQRGYVASRILDRADFVIRNASGYETAYRGLGLKEPQLQDKPRLELMSRLFSLQRAAQLWPLGLFEEETLVMHPLNRPGRKYLFYCRPLTSSRRWYLKNAFPPRQEFSFPVEPKHLSVEAILGRCLYTEFTLVTVGGVYDATCIFGRNEILIDGDQYGTEAAKGWWNIVMTYIGQCHGFLIVPGSSNGIRDEVEWIIKSDFLGRSALIMLPAEAYGGMAEHWCSTVTIFREYGIDIPFYSPAGGVFIFNKDNNVERVFSFDKVFDGLLAPTLAVHIPDTTVGEMVGF